MLGCTSTEIVLEMKYRSESIETKDRFLISPAIWCSYVSLESREELLAEMTISNSVTITRPVSRLLLQTPAKEKVQQRAKDRLLHFSIPDLSLYSV